MKLTTIMAKFGDYEHESDGLVAHCPSHNDSKPSLKVILKSDGRLLIACRAGCGFVDILKKAGLTARQLSSVENDIGIKEAKGERGPVADEHLELLVDYCERAALHLNSAESDDALNYLLNRFGISQTLAEAWGLGYDDGNQAGDWSLLSLMYSSVPRVVVPFRDSQGNIKGMQSRDISNRSPAKWAGPSNPEEGGSWANLAFFDSGSGLDCLVVCEGPGDAMTTAGAGGFDSVGIRGASLAKKPEVIQEIKQAAGHKRVVVVGDNDRAGKQFTDTLAKGLTGAGVANVTVLPGMPAADVSDWFALAGEDFKQEFNTSISRSVELKVTKEEEEESAGDFVGRISEDVGLAELVFEANQQRICWVFGIGFMLYKAGVWVRDVNKEHRRVVSSAAELLESHLDKEDYSENGRLRFKAIKKAMKGLRSTVVLDRVIKELETVSAVDLDKFDRYSHLLVVANGVVNLETGELGSHDPNLRLTQKVEVAYDPKATAPRWASFLKEVFPDDPEDMSAFMQRLVGYSISGNTDEQCFAVLWGRGANGKSVFTNTIGNIFEGLTEVTPFQTFEEKAGGGIPNDLAALRGARIVMASEGERGKPMAEAVIKRVTGQDRMSARFMRQEFFTFTPSFMLFMGTNHKPSFKSADDGLWRRVKLIPFTHFFKPENRDPKLELKLKGESEGILAWAIQGSQLYFEGGLQEPPCIVGATAEYRTNSDALADFYGEGKVLVPSTNLKDFVATGDAWQAYEDWCDEEGFSMKERWTSRAFKNALEERGLTALQNPDRSNRRRGYFGVRLSRH